MRGNKISISVTTSCLFWMSFWELILLNKGFTWDFFLKPNPQNCTNYIWFLNYVFTRNKKLEEQNVIYYFSSRRWSLFQPVMKYQCFQKGDKKLIRNSFVFCAVLSPAQEKTVTIQVEYEVRTLGIYWCDPGGNHFDPGGLSPGEKGCWKEQAQQELITEFIILILQGAGQAHWFALRTILGLDSGRLGLTLWCVGYPAEDSLFSSVLPVVPHWNTEVNHRCGQC